jgi:hypothetical protein
MWAFYIPTMAVVLAATAAVQRKYAAPTVPWPARAIVAVAWVTSASIVALVPIDVVAALMGAGGRSTAAVATLWTAAYWTTQALTWGVIPIAAGMADAGDFTLAGRLRTSLRDSALYYGALATAALAGLGPATGVEALPTPQAAALFNVLSQEGRLVVGAFLPAGVTE